MVKKVRCKKEKNKRRDLLLGIKNQTTAQVNLLQYILNFLKLCTYLPIFQILFLLVIFPYFFGILHKKQPSLLSTSKLSTSTYVHTQGVWKFPCSKVDHKKEWKLLPFLLWNVSQNDCSKKAPGVFQTYRLGYKKRRHRIRLFIELEVTAHMTVY